MSHWEFLFWAHSLVAAHAATVAVHGAAVACLLAWIESVRRWTA